LNYAWSIPLSDVTILKPTTVSLVFKATAACTVTIAAIRAIHEDWTPTRLDMDTRTQRLVLTVDRDGQISDVDFPRMWRSFSPPRIDLDPKPINARLGISFFTGSMTQDNTMSLFFRGRREDMLTQLDLDGVDEISQDGIHPVWGENQQSLRKRGKQPDYGSAMYNPRAQADLDGLDQKRMSIAAAKAGQKPMTYDPAPGLPPSTNVYMWQAEMERVSDIISESYVEARLTWGATNELYIGTSESLNDEDFIVFDMTDKLEPQTLYLLSIDNTNNAVRVHIYPMTPEGGIIEDELIFDTTDIINEFLIKRRKGRIGWSLDIQDGDAWIDGIRTRGLVFGELLTNNFESFTPVEGAQIYVGGTSDTTLTTNHNAYNGATIAQDIHNTKSPDGSLKVIAEPLTGVESVWTTFDDFTHTQIMLDVWYPKLNLNLGQRLQAGLINPKGFIIPVPVSGLVGDRWASLTLRPTSAINEQTGVYKFILLQSHGDATFWVDNLRINQQAIAWQGRSTLNDPWNRFNNVWTDYLTYINADQYSAMFPTRGPWLQIRGQALTQDSSIEKLYTKPKYAQLGRLTWDVGRRYRDVNLSDPPIEPYVDKEWVPPAVTFTRHLLIQNDDANSDPPLFWYDFAQPRTDIWITYQLTFDNLHVTPDDGGDILHLLPYTSGTEGHIDVAVVRTAATHALDGNFSVSVGNEQLTTTITGTGEDEVVVQTTTDNSVTVDTGPRIENHLPYKVEMHATRTNLSGGNVTWKLDYYVEGQLVTTQTKTMVAASDGPIVPDDIGLYQWDAIRGFYLTPAGAASHVKYYFDYVKAGTTRGRGDILFLDFNTGSTLASFTGTYLGAGTAQVTVNG
jgi:hypothetical protein